MSQNTTPASTNTTRGDPAQPAPAGGGAAVPRRPIRPGDLAGQPRLHPPSQPVARNGQPPCRSIYSARPTDAQVCRIVLVLAAPSRVVHLRHRQTLLDQETDFASCRLWVRSAGPGAGLVVAGVPGAGAPPGRWLPAVGCRPRAWRSVGLGWFMAVPFCPEKDKVHGRRWKRGRPGCIGEFPGCAPRPSHPPCLRASCPEVAER